MHVSCVFPPVQRADFCRFAAFYVFIFYLGSNITTTALPLSSPTAIDAAARERPRLSQGLPTARSTTLSLSHCSTHEAAKSTAARGRSHTAGAPVGCGTTCIHKAYHTGTSLDSSIDNRRPNSWQGRYHQLFRPGVVDRLRLGGAASSAGLGAAAAGLACRAMASEKQARRRVLPTWPQIHHRADARRADGVDPIAPQCGERAELRAHLRRRGRRRRRGTAAARCEHTPAVRGLLARRRGPLSR